MVIPVAWLACDGEDKRDANKKGRRAKTHSCFFFAVGCQFLSDRTGGTGRQFCSEINDLRAQG